MAPVKRLHNLANQAKQLPRRKHDLHINAYHVVEKLQASLEQLGESAAKAADAMELKANAENRKHYLEWIDGAFEKGAAGAHRYIRGPALWCPESTDAPGGEVSHGLAFNLTASPGVLVKKEADGWNKIWTGDPLARAPIWPKALKALDKPTVCLVRSASESCKRRTGVGIDDSHPRDISQLSDEAIEVLIDLLMICERLGNMP